MPLKLIKITVEAGLYNLPFSFPAWKCQDLETSMRGTRTISVDSLVGQAFVLRGIKLPKWYIRPAAAYRDQNLA